MKFLIDADLPRSAAQALRGDGHDASHVADSGLGQASDREIFDCAQKNGAVLVTRDLDFADPLQFPERQHCGLIIVRIRETLPPAFVNRTLAAAVAALRDDEFSNSIIIVEESRFRRRTL
ncbi:MAG: DUF5615 family PIN-like protein [Planctomycetia bacterium]|nr:DUF5615 family PIN-like protein [Planctomycetia bacterium]